MRIVIFGAAGIGGRGLCRRLGAEHDLVLVDREPIEDPEATFVRGDVNDPALFLAVMQDAHASVYLPLPSDLPHGDACDASQGLDFDINVRSVYWWLAAAARLGVARTVFASSLSVFDLETSPETITEQKLPDPTAVYGLTNQLGEETCRYFASRYAMTVVVLRLGFVCDPDRWAVGGPPRPFPRTHVEDVAEAIRLGLTRPLNGFQLVHIFGERSQFGWSDRHADEVLGFRVHHRHPGHG